MTPPRSKIHAVAAGMTAAVTMSAALTITATIPQTASASAPTPASSAKTTLTLKKTTKAQSDREITISTYNICKKECAKGQWAWQKRIPKLAKTILASNSDIVAVQEAYEMTGPLLKQLKKHGWAQAGTHAGTEGCGAGCVQEAHLYYNTRTIEETPTIIPNPPMPQPCKPYPPGNQGVYPEPEPIYPKYPTPRPTEPTKPPTDAKNYRELYEQYQVDYNQYLQDLAAYEAAVADYPNAVARHKANKAAWKEAKISWAQTYRQNKCYLYDPWPEYRNGSAGFPSLKTLNGGMWQGTATERLAGWAIFTHKPTNTQFLAVSAHMPPEKNPKAEKTRRSATKALLKHLAEIRNNFGTPNLPTFIAADLNSFQERQPQGSQKIVEQAGYVDAWKAKKKTNKNYNTINYSGIQRHPFPAKPIYSKNGTPARIDYVFNNRTFTPSHYELFLKLKNGQFDNSYRASDHNLVKTTWTIPEEYTPQTAPTTMSTEEDLYAAGKRINTSIPHPQQKAWLAKPYLGLQ